MDNGTIYVLMPAYNVGKFISAAFDSLIEQTYTNWVCLCMNDGSKDNTWDIMQKYAEQDSRIHIFTQENKGLTATLNILLDKVQGPYLAYLDSDDSYHPQMLEILMEALIKEKADVSETILTRFYDTVPEELKKKLNYNDLKIETINDMNIFWSKKTARGAWINKVSKVYCWDKVKDIRFSEELAHEDDYFYGSIVDASINRKVLIDYPLYFYRKNPNSMCGNVNWQRYQRSGINRIRLSYDTFIKTNKVPDAYVSVFMSDLTNDAYRMIIRKPLKKGSKDIKNEVFNNACESMQKYIRDGIIDCRYLSLIRRIHVWFVCHHFKRISCFISKLS